MKEETKATVQTEEVKKTAVKADEKPEPKKRGRKPKTEAEKKASTAKKTTRTTKKATENTTQTLLEYQGNQIDISKIEESIKAQFVAEGHRAGNIKTLNIYVKPEEYKAYYVINDGKFTGDVNLF